LYTHEEEETMNNQDALDSIRRATEVFGEPPTVRAIARFRAQLEKQSNEDGKRLAAWMDAHPAEVAALTGAGK